MQQSAFSAGLIERVDAALARATDLQRRSFMLRIASEHCRHGEYTTVCAWCGAFAIGSDFFSPGEEPVFARYSRVTHGICPDCLERLHDEGLTH